MSVEQLYQVLEMGAQNPPPASGDPQEMRAWFEAMMAPTPVAAGVAITSVEVAGQPCEMLRPEGAPDSGLDSGPEGKLILYVHGGGWIFGSPRSHRVIATNLARASGVPVLSVQYRMAPEHPAPAARDDVFAAYEWALAQGCAPGSIALAGDSAGGNLALATAVRARAAGLPLPGALVLLSPALDLAGEGASHSEMADAPLVDAGFMALVNALYLGDRDPKAPEITPFYADMTGLPPTQIQIGTWELLRSDSETLAARMRDAGVDVALTIWEGMCHNHQLFAPFLEEGMASIEQAGGFLRDRLA